ncbi:MAG: AAA family ATPase [Bacteroidaceae bacterium]|nr:AAA family ATPase [Bacteroidaceae bacterium]
MTKDIFLNHLHDYINKLEILYQASNIYSDIPNNLPIKEIIAWIENLIVDIKTDKVPTFFYSILLHNIEELKITDLPQDPSYYESVYIKKCNQHWSKVLKEIYINIEKATEYINNYFFYKSLDFASQNTVLVGANGCGKTALANSLTKTLNMNDGIVIPAQKLLIIPTFESTPNYKTALERYNSYQTTILDNKQTFNTSMQSDVPYPIVQKYGTEYRYVLSTLLAERLYVRNTYCDKIQNGKSAERNELNSKLDTVIDVWNDLIKHRILKCDQDNNLIIECKNEDYPAHQMSDGERIILYLTGRILLAPQNALIIVDEPEVHLHRTIVDKLWNRLEAMREDCTFIYFTHDLEFATNRIAQKYWMKSFTYPSSWQIEKIEENEIPQELLLNILGSKKKILFCEGKKYSLDTQIFEILFPHYTITPVSTCKDVINYTKAFNSLHYKDTTAIGIIDRDFREEAQLLKLQQQNIYSYDVAEIENLFLVEDFIKDFSKYIHEDCDIEIIKTKIIDKLEADKHQQVSFFISNKINHYFTIYR